MDTAFKVLELLCHADGAVSGEEIGTRLGLSRSAVCKHIGKLRGVGFSIESTTNVGHRLRFDRDLYNAYTLALALKAEGMEMPVSFLETVDSTNLEAKRAGYEQAEGLVAARRQTGRKSRGFSSEAGGLYFSYYCRPAHLLPYDAVKAVLTAGLSVAEALRECGADAGIKWPNDVLIGGKKVCGILCEMISGADEVQKLILGIGINVKNDLPPELAETAASLKVLGLDIDCASLCASVVRRLREYLGLLEAGEFPRIAEKYNACSLTLGRTVNVVEERKSFTARAVGLDVNGFLRVDTGAGEELVVTGDVTIRNA